MATRNAEINRLLNSMGLKKGGIDGVFLRVLETVIAISKYRLNSRTVSSEYHEIVKYKIFWRAMREIADLEIISLDRSNLHISPFERVEEAFPDKEKEKDGRMWLPMCWYREFLHSSIYIYKLHDSCRVNVYYLL